MRSNVSAQVNKVTTILFLTGAFALPLFFDFGQKFSTDLYDSPKLIFLFILLCLLLLLKGASWVMSGKVIITRTPLDLPLLLFLIVLIISSLHLGDPSSSTLRYDSFFGGLPKIHGATITWILYVIFYFLAVSHLKTLGQVKSIFSALLLSSVVLALLSLFSYFGAYLPIPFAKSPNFTPAGSSFAMDALLVAILPIVLLSLTTTKKVISQAFALPIAILFALVLAFTGSFPILLTSLAIFVVVLAIEMGSAKISGKTAPLFVPLVIFLAAFVLGIAPLGNLTIFHDKAQSFPREIQLDFPTSWKVSASAFRDAPLFGTGPQSYLNDFTQYKPIEYNQTPYWNIRFDTPSDEFLGIFATAGILGLVAFAFIALVIFTFSKKALKKNMDNPWTVGVSLSALSGLLLLFLHPSTLVSVIVLFLVLACLMALNKAEYDKVEELSIGIKAWNPTRSDLIVGDALPTILLVAFVLLIAFSIIKASPMIAADYHHRKALNAASSQGVVTYNELITAEQLNPMVDLYRTDLAQTNFALANAIAQSKGPTQASPSGSLTDSDKQNIQTLISQSINEGKAAVALNPRSAQNWEILASIYRQISGIAQNAASFSLDAYGHAIQQDPYNPLLRMSVGGVYYSLKNYDLAVRFFTDSVNLKPDYANGYYNLAVALRDQGNLQGAVSAAETLVTLVDKKSPDYKTATKLLSDLKNQLASKGSENTQASGNTPPPAAAQTSALQKKELPKVLNLPQPSSIATPSAIKK